MNCQESRIQAYLDGELSREERKELARHLEHCTQCQTTLAELKRLEAWVDDAIHDALAPIPEASIRIDVDAAWAAFEAKRSARSTSAPQREVQAETPVPTTQVPRTRGWSSMTKAYKKWIAGSAAAVMVIGALTIPQVQAATNDLLQLFRVEKVQMVEFNQQDINDIKNFLQSGNLGQKDLKDLGKITVDAPKGAKHVSYASAEQAKQAGLTVASVPSGYQISHIDVSPVSAIHLQLNIDKVNAMLKDLGSNQTFDPSLNNQTITITWPQETTTQFVSSGQPNTSVSWRYTTDSQAPKLEVPTGVDVNQLRSTVLSLPFIPDHIKQQLAGIQDWQNTLPIPVMQGQQNEQKITVNGQEGLFTGSPDSTDGQLIWQKDNHVQTLSVHGWNPKDGDLKQALLKMAAAFE